MPVMTHDEAEGLEILEHVEGWVQHWHTKKCDLPLADCEDGAHYQTIYLIRKALILLTVEAIAQFSPR